MKNSAASVQTWVIKRYKLIFWLLFIAAFVSGYYQVLQNKKLKNETASRGIISLELGKSFEIDTAIIFSWTRYIEPDTSSVNQNDCEIVEPVNRLKLAAKNISVDFLFIVCYTCLLIVIIFRLQRDSKKRIFTRLLISSAIVAGIADIIENIAMLSLIANVSDGSIADNHNYLAVVTKIAAYAKFIILALLVGGYLLYMLIVRQRVFVVLSSFLSEKLKQVYQYRVIFLGIAVFVIPIWILDQGQDLLINSNAERPGVIFFLTAISILALVNWYLAKLFFNGYAKRDVYPFEEPILANLAKQVQEQKISRFLGVSTFLLPAAAVLNTLQVSNVHYGGDIFPPIASLLELLTISFILIKYDLATKAFHWLRNVTSIRFAKRASIFVILMIALIIPYFISIYKGDEIRRSTSLICLYWHLVMLAFAFYLFVSVRSQVFNNPGWLGLHVGKLIFTLALICSLTFLAINISPLILARQDIRYMTLPLLICGAVFYIFTFTLLLRLSQLWKINIVFFIIVLAFLISATGVNNYHRVHMIDRARENSEVNLPTLEDYFRQWVIARKEEIKKDTLYPIFLVNTYGGGIRASAFTSMALTYLDSALIQKRHRGFQHYTFSISGASGGTIGAVVNCLYRYKCMNDSNAYKLNTFHNFYQHDFLTPLLITDIGRDIWASATNTSLWQDRAAIAENTWTYFGKKYLGIDMDIGYDAIWNTSSDKAYEVPLLFSNSLNVDDGLKGIYAPVRLSKKDFPATIFIREIVDSINSRKPETESLKDISLITGGFLSARFPFLCPGGKMGAGFHFIDGGGKDNSGASTSDQIFTALAKYASIQYNKVNKTAEDSLFCRLVESIQFYFVSINNSPNHYEPRKLIENRFELISPVVGIVNSGIDGNAHAADSTLLYRYGDTLIHQGFPTGYFSIFPTTRCVDDPQLGKYVPILPLGWQISAPALRRLKGTFMKTNIKEDVGALGGILRAFDKPKDSVGRSNSRIINK
jgi:hypothetical protein